jgi:hypothetical protein
MGYPFILIPLITGTFTQIVKFVLSVIRHKKVEIRYLVTPGHMPSSHTSFAVSLATLVGFESGIGSIDFAIAVCLAYVIIYDAMNIRIHIGNNGAAVNRIVKDLHLTGYPTLKERVGHLPQEVLVGGLLGFFCTVGLLRFF